MNITKITSQISPKIKTKATNFFVKHGEFGEATNIAMDFLGKAAIAPAIILLSPTNKKDNNNKKMAAIKNPIGATSQLLCEIPILFGTTKIMEKLANKGIFDKANSNFSYNVKQAYENCMKSAPNLKKQALKNLQDTEKHLHHLSNRAVFIMALLTTPLVCMAENKVHTKIFKRSVKND